MTAITYIWFPICLVFTIIRMSSHFSGHPVHHRPNINGGPHHLRGETAFLTSFKNGWTRKKTRMFFCWFQIDDDL